VDPYAVPVISSLAAWTGNKTPRKWQWHGLKLLWLLDLAAAKVVLAHNAQVSPEYTKEAWANQLSSR
jgi:hypothetical protein